MLKRGYLAGNSVYVCLEHTPVLVTGVFDALDPIFAVIKECEIGRDVMSLLNGPICHSAFRRLN
jgi:glutamate-1-semialdehyde 2,1-aminomutase